MNKKTKEWKNTRLEKKENEKNAKGHLHVVNKRRKDVNDNKSDEENGITLIDGIIDQHLVQQ